MDIPVHVLPHAVWREMKIQSEGLNIDIEFFEVHVLYDV